MKFLHTEFGSDRSANEVAISCWNCYSTRQV